MKYYIQVFYADGSTAITWVENQTQAEAKLKKLQEWPNESIGVIFLPEYLFNEYFT